MKCCTSGILKVFGEPNKNQSSGGPRELFEGLQTMKLPSETSLLELFKELKCSYGAPQCFFGTRILKFLVKLVVDLFEEPKSSKSF